MTARSEEDGFCISYRNKKKGRREYAPMHAAERIRLLLLLLAALLPWLCVGGNRHRSADSTIFGRSCGADTTFAPAPAETDSTEVWLAVLPLRTNDTLVSRHRVDRVRVDIWNITQTTVVEAAFDIWTVMPSSERVPPMYRLLADSRRISSVTCECIILDAESPGPAFVECNIADWDPFHAMHTSVTAYDMLVLSMSYYITDEAAIPTYCAVADNTSQFEWYQTTSHDSAWLALQTTAPSMEITTSTWTPDPPTQPPEDPPTESPTMPPLPPVPPPPLSPPPTLPPQSPPAPPLPPPPVLPSVPPVTTESPSPSPSQAAPADPGNILTTQVVAFGATGVTAVFASAIAAYAIYHVYRRRRLEEGWRQIQSPDPEEAGTVLDSSIPLTRKPNRFRAPIVPPSDWRTHTDNNNNNNDKDRLGKPAEELIAVVHLQAREPYSFPLPGEAREVTLAYMNEQEGDDAIVVHSDEEQEAAEEEEDSDGDDDRHGRDVSAQTLLLHTRETNKKKSE